MAPELVRKEPYDNKVDTWAAGIVAYIVLTGKFPFINRTNDADENRGISLSI